MATHSFSILAGGKLPEPVPPVVALFGDDAFLRGESAVAIIRMMGLDTADYRSFDGEECKWIDVHDELATLSLFDSGGYRAAMVTAADRLVEDARSQLEKWCGAPAKDSVLLLQVASLPTNTRLYKLIDKHGMCVQCSLPTGGPRSKTPSIPKLRDWLVEWARARCELSLTASQASAVIDAIGTDCGLLHQEVSKLALYADENGKLTDEVLRASMGSWRTRTVWEVADAIADGRVTAALEQLQKIFAAGESPSAVIPQLSWSLRRFGKAAQLLLQSKRLRQRMGAQVAITQAGFWGNDAKLAEQRLRRMGLRKAGRLPEWLLELDLKIKGTHSQPGRAIFALEELCVRLADTERAS